MPLWNYTVLSPATKVLKTFVVAILWVFSALPSRSWWCNMTKVPSLHCWSQSREQVKNSWSQSGEYGGCSSVVTLFFAKKSLTKTDRCAGALWWRRNQTLVLQFSGRFLLTTSLRRRRISLYISLFTVAVPAKYTSKFWELFEATAYIDYVSTCVCIYVCTYRCVFVRRPSCCKKEARATDIKSTGIIDLTTYILVECYRTFGWTYCLNFSGTSNLSFNVVSS